MHTHLTVHFVSYWNQVLRMLLILGTDDVIDGKLFK